MINLEKTSRFRVPAAIFRALFAISQYIEYANWPDR